MGEELWRNGEMQRDSRGLRVRPREGDQLPWLHNELSVTIEEQDEGTWWLML